MTTAHAPQPRSRAVARGWRNFRRWRRSRPFWGGLLLLVSGAEIFYSGNMDLGNLHVQFGPQGFLIYLVPGVLVLCGALVWLSPAQRLFYGVVGALVAVYSLIGVNLGGWLIGLLLGVTGGALSVAWTPVTPVPPAGWPDPYDEETEGGDRPDAEPETDPRLTPAGVTGMDHEERLARQPEPRPEPERATVEDSDGPDPAANEPRSGLLTDMLPTATRSPLHDQRAASDDDPGDPPRTGRTHPGLLAIVLIASTLAAVALATVQRPTPALAGPCDPVPSRAAKPIPGPATVPTRAPTPPAPTTAAPTSAPVTTSPTAEPSAPATSAAAATDGSAVWDVLVQAPDAVAAAVPVATGAAPARGTVTPCAPTPAPARTLAAAADQPVVQQTPSLMTAASLSMNGLSFDGVVDLPTKTGTIKVLQFSMAKSVATPFQLSVPGPNSTSITLRSSSLTVERNVGFYATRVTGKLFGVLPVTYTPDAPPVLTVSDVIFTDAEIELVYVRSESLTAPALVIG